MDTSLLNQNSLSTLIRLRKHFNDRATSFIKSQFSYDDPNYLKYKDFVEKIDKIIDQRFFYEITTEYNQNPNEIGN